MTGYAANSYYESDSETASQITTKNLSEVFESASADGAVLLDGTGEEIAAAVENPLKYRDFLILDSNDEISFDHDYVR